MKDTMSSIDMEKLGRKVGWRLALFGAAALVVAFNGVNSREKTQVDLAKWTQAQAIEAVDVVSPSHGVGDQELILPGEIQAWFTAPIYARVSGYVKMWYKDFGAKVKGGDVLAQVDTPDLDEKLAQAKGDLERAQANATLSELTATRWKALQRSNAVSQQAIDEKVGDYQAKLAEVTAAKAYVAQLNAFETFKQLTAPFEGVVTARKVDVGALVQTSNGDAPALFEIADLHEMRIYVEVPQAFASQLHAGMKAQFKLPQYPGRRFDAVVATTSDAIARRSRTLLVELHSDNKDDLLQSGSYAEVNFELPPDDNALVLPASALVFREDGPQVAVVNPDHKIVLKRIEIGRDLGTEIEVRSGIAATDKVVRNPSDSIASGDVIRIAGQDESPSQISAR